MPLIAVVSTSCHQMPSIHDDAAATVAVLPSLSSPDIKPDMTGRRTGGWVRDVAQSLLCQRRWPHLQCRGVKAQSSPVICVACGVWLSTVEWDDGCGLWCVGGAGEYGKNDDSMI